jgi:hypothetical protein
MRNTTFLESLMIREYLWNSGDGDGIIDGFYHYTSSNDMKENVDDYWYVIELIDNYVPSVLIDVFSNMENQEDCIDLFEKKIEEIILPYLVDPK